MQKYKERKIAHSHRKLCSKWSDHHGFGNGEFSLTRRQHADSCGIFFFIIFIFFQALHLFWVRLGGLRGDISAGDREHGMKI